MSSSLVLMAYAGSALAGDVTVFRPSEKPQVLTDPLNSTAEAAPDAVQTYLQKNGSAIGLENFGPGRLRLMKTEKSPYGFAVRFAQTDGKVVVDGAELVALFSPRGDLEALNTSLADDAPYGAKKDREVVVTSAQAVQTAVKALGIRSLQLGQGKGDGLRLVRSGGKYVKVWQISLLDTAGHLEPKTVRIVASGVDAGKVHSVKDAAQSIAPVSIYDGSFSLLIPGLINNGMPVMKEGKKIGVGKLIAGKVAKAANLQLGRTLEYYQTAFSRDSYDNAGAEIHASVNVKKFRGPDFLGMHENAAWMSPFKLFIFGSGGRKMDDFEKALDVIGHEFTHAVIDESSNLEYEKQSGALNEHLADLFGAMIQQNYENTTNPWLMGEGVLKPGRARGAQALRDMMNPERGLSKQPGHVSQISPEFGPECDPRRRNDHCGVHDNSGIPNRAAALMVDAVGWDKLKGVFYRVMTQRLRSTSDFSDYRAQVVAECMTQLSAADCTAVKAAFDAVGM